MSTPPTFAAACSTRPHSQAAVEEVTQEGLNRLGGNPDLALVFFSAHHVSQAEAMATQLAERLGHPCLLGCSGESIVATQREIEGEPAVSLWLAKLPGVTLVPMHLRFERTPEGGSLVGWPESLAEEWPAGASMLALGDPYSFPPELLLEVVNDEHGGVPVVGGMASTAMAPGENRLILGGGCFDSGAVAVVLHGPVRVRTLVSQGCRPIGQPFVITRSERNVIAQLGGMPAYQRLVEVFQSLATHEQQMLQRGLHLGRVVSEYQDHFEQGDFLVRNVMGVDEQSGAVVVGDFMRTGQTVQFHVRDHDTADAELKQLLARASREGSHPSGALLFTCNGRGSRLFPEPNHDANAIAQEFGQLPVAGFFAAGEMGPIGGRNFLHGFTASIALFEAVSEA